MSDVSPILGLPYIQASQAQKHVTHNESIQLLDAIVQLAVADRTLTVAPALPLVGQRHIVAAGATGLWAGQGGKIAVYADTGWQFISPLAGWQAHVLAEGDTAVFTGTVWASPEDVAQRFPQVGINATADSTNRLTVSAPATLLNHAGSGHQLKLNKNAAADTASLLFQTGFSGRAEMGTAGTDDFSIKVSAAGSSFADALVANRTSGQVSLPNGLLSGDGTASAPGISFVADTDTGLRRPAANQMAIITGGTQRALLSNTALQIDVPVTGSAVQSSPSDPTAGRLLATGALGWAGNDINLTDVTDLDALRTSGFHRWSSGAIGAPVLAGTMLHVPRLTGTGEGRHIQMAFGQTGSVSARHMAADGSWNAWTTLQRSGQPLVATDISGSGLLTLGGNPMGGTILTIADDAAGTLTPPRTGGFAAITCAGQTATPLQQFSGLIFFNVGTALAISKSTHVNVATLLDVVTTNVTGVSGVDGRATVAVQAGVIKIENRTALSRTFQITYF